MNIRAPADLHFCAAIPMPYEAPATGAWGTKWDLGGQSYFGDNNKLHSQAEGLPKPFRSILEYSFSTAWSPPTEWFAHVSSEFDTIAMVMTSDDGSDGTVFTQMSAHGDDTEHEELECPKVPERPDGEDEDNDEGLSAEELAARTQAYLRHEDKLSELAPPVRNLPQIVLSIHRDQDDIVGSWLDEEPGRLNGLIDDLWAPIHHAAHADAVQTFLELLNRGADAAVRGRNGLGVMDYLTDERGDERNPSTSTPARLQMLEALAQVAPQVLDEPLSTGLRPVELAARYGMTDLLRVLVPKVDHTSTSSPCRQEFDKDEQAPGWIATAADHAIGPARCVILNALNARDSEIAIDAATRFLASAMKPCRLASLQDESVVAEAAQMLPASVQSAQYLNELIEKHESYEQSLRTKQNVRDEEKLQPNDVLKRELLRTVVRRMHAHMAIEDIEGHGRSPAP